MWQEKTSWQGLQHSNGSVHASLASILRIVDRLHAACMRREELTALLRRAKIVLNVHFYPAKVLEICRIVEAISFGALVRRSLPGQLDEIVHVSATRANPMRSRSHCLMRRPSSLPACRMLPWICGLMTPKWKWQAGNAPWLWGQPVLAWQVVSEPGADAELDAQWDGKVVFAEGVDALAEQLQLYRCACSMHACARKAVLVGLRCSRDAGC